jgi:hypothetical protein
MLASEVDDVERMPAETLVAQGLCDAVYTFIKDEPHKEEKVRDNRFRLISCMSLVDTTIQRLLFRRQNNLEISLNKGLTFKPGMGLHDDGLKALFAWFKRVEENFTRDGHRVCSTDISGWDWSVPGWLMCFERDYRIALGDATSGWAHLVRVNSVCTRRKVFQLENGDTFAQSEDGIQASGCYCTSSGNSHMRCGLSICVQLELGFNGQSEMEGAQMGDDALERFLHGLEEMYKEYGFKVKGVQTMEPGHFEFCSTLWENEWAGQPTSWKKTLFRFLFQDFSSEMLPMLLEQLRRDLRHHHDRVSILSRVSSFIEEVVVNPRVDPSI